MAFNITEIVANLNGGGARPALFNITITNPVDNSAQQKLTFTARAASLPGWQIGTVPVYYFGRPIKLAGDRTFDPWNITVINDEDFAVRNAFEAWNNRINMLEQNIRAFNTSAPAEYRATQASVQQFGKTGEILRTYTFVNIWPSNIAPIELDWQATDRVEEFNITLNYDYFYVDDVNGAITGNAGGR